MPPRIFSFETFRLLSMRAKTMAGITPAEPPVGAVMTRWPRAFSSEAASAKAETRAIALSAAYLSSWARSNTVDALEWSLIGPGSTSSLKVRPTFTVATMAFMILSRKALTSASLLPELVVSLGIISWATVRLFFSAWPRSSFIVAYGYFGGFFLGGV